MKRFLIFREETLVLRHVWTACLLLICFSITLNIKAQSFSRDLKVDLLVNQAGYVPNTSKTVVTKGLTDREYEVISLETLTVVLKGNFRSNKCDFGDYSTGDFSSLTQEGHYYIKSGELRSYPFQISERIYYAPMSLIVGYFT